MTFAPPQYLVDRLSGVRFVVMDVDGTIRSQSDTIGQGVAQVLGRLERAGIGWSFATGRTIAGLRAAAPAVLNRRRGRPLPAICCNGAVLFVPGAPDLLSVDHVDEPDVRRAIDTARHLGLTAYIYRCSDKLGTPAETVHAIGRPNRIAATDVNGMPVWPIEDPQNADLSDVVAILLQSTDGTRDLERLSAILGPSLSVTASGDLFYEISQAGTSKGKALGRLVDELRSLSKRHRAWSGYADLAVHEVMAVGDSYNDMDMMRVAGVGVAVANAPEQVRRDADYVCSLPAGQGVVEAIRLLLNVHRYGQRYPLGTMGGLRAEAAGLFP